jgi:sugar phosphate isomerase/epimerase
MNLSYQLYSSREDSDLAGVLKHLADTGYTQVEGFGGVMGDPAGLRAMMDPLGLTMPSAHFAIDDLEAKPDEMLALAKTLGVQSMYAPFLHPNDRPTDVAGWTAFAERLAAAGKVVTAAGYNFGWHNHDFEFVTLEDGSTPMELILKIAVDLEWEADLAWVVRGGADPFEWIDRYAGRITSVHLKDIAPEGECMDEDGWADVGEGVMPWADLLHAVRTKTPARTFVMEHDKPADPRRFAERAFANVQKMSA